MPVPGPAVEKKLPSASQWPSQTRPSSLGLHRRAPAATIFHPLIRVNIQEVRPPKELTKEVYRETLQLRRRWQLFSNSINSLTLTYHHHRDRTDCIPGPLQTGTRSSDGKGLVVCCSQRLQIIPFVNGPNSFEEKTIPTWASKFGKLRTCTMKRSL